MKWLRCILGLGLLLAVLACGRMTHHVSAEDMKEAQCQYDSACRLLQSDSLKQALPMLLQAAGKLEVLPEDMDSAAVQLSSQAYVQMAHVFKLYIEDNAEIDALKRALYYQRMVNDTSLTMHANLELANAYFCIMEHDSAAYYLDRVKPYLDTVKGNLDDYFSAQRLVSDLYYDLHEFDSCFLVMHELIAFKTRRGLDTKNDSVNLGIAMFHSPYCPQSKPYLLKALDSDIDDMKLGAIMSLLTRIYEAEGNADSVAFCQKYHASYVKAETDRVSDGLLAVKQYDNYKAERDARLTALRAEKASQKARVLRIIYVFVALLLLAAIIFVIYHRAYRKRMTQEHEEIKRDLQEAHGALETQAQEAIRMKVRSIYDDKRNNSFSRILEVFNTAYPEALGKLKAQYPDLNETELDICVLSYFPFRTKEIADILDLRENTVSKYRTSIKKKTQTETFEGLWTPFVG